MMLKLLPTFGATLVMLALSQNVSAASPQTATPATPATVLPAAPVPAFDLDADVALFFQGFQGWAGAFAEIGNG